jgi:subtilisin family serine protease
MTSISDVRTQTLLAGRTRTPSRVTRRLLAWAAALAVALAGVAPTAAAQRNAAGKEPEFARDRVIVKWKDSTPAAAAAGRVASLRAREKRRMNFTDVRVLDVQQTGKSVKDVVSELQKSGLVEYAEPDYLVEVNATPSDPRFRELFGLHNTGQTGGVSDADIDAPEAWDVTTGDSQVVVAVIDTGVDYTHPDLAPNMWVNPRETRNGRDDDGNGYIDDVHGINAITGSGDPMDDHYHGTHCAGTIGAVGDNGVGVTGVAWDVQIMGLKFLSASGIGYVSDAIEALEYALRMKTLYGVNLKLTSNSWGGGGYSQALVDAIRATGDAGMLFVAAAGNDDRDTDLVPHYPSSYDLPSIVSVAATDAADRIAYFSNRGVRSVDLAAPGVSILSTLPGNQYGLLSGTSMAAPHVSGVAALFFSRFPDAQPARVKAALLDNVDPVPGLASLTLSGGRLNAMASIGCDAGQATLRVTPGDGFSVELGSSVPVEATVASCGTPITNAAVAVTPSGQAALTARDDGVAPDRARADGVYTTAWAPQSTGPVTLTVDAALATGRLTDSITGEVYSIPVYQIDPYAAFTWIDATSGTNAGLDQVDDGFAEIPIGFGFGFYGQTYDRVKVSSNGYLTFGSNGTAYGNTSLPLASEPNALIAPYWDDLYPGAGSGSVRYLLRGAPGQRELTVAWIGVNYYGSAATATFEVTLYEGSNRMVFRYLDVDAGATAQGLSATVGIENADGTRGLAYSVNQSMVRSRQAIAISTAAACRDGRDNDGDGFVDFPADPGCRDASDDSERDGVAIVSPTPADAPLAEGRTYAIEWTADATTARVDVFWKGSKKKTGQWTPIASGVTSTQVDFTVPSKTGGQHLTFMVKAFDGAGNEVGTGLSQDLEVAKAKKGKKDKKKNSN